MTFIPTEPSFFGESCIHSPTYKDDTATKLQPLKHLTAMAKLSLTAQVGMAASMATSQSGQFHISQDSIDELREAKRKRRLWTVVVGSGTCLRCASMGV